MTTIIHESNIDVKLETENNENINLVMQYFIPNDRIRINEIKETLVYNLKNPYINTVYLLNERYYTNLELGINKLEKKYVSKLKQVNIEKRITFKKMFDWTKENKITGYIIFCNTDIFFDSVQKILNDDKLSKDMSIESKKVFYKNFTIKASMNRYLDLIHKLG